MNSYIKLEKHIPRYENSFTISPFLPSIQDWYTFSEVWSAEKNITFAIFTLNFNNLQYSEKLSRIICNHSFESENKTISSAHNNTKNFRYIYMYLLSSFLEMHASPWLFLFTKIVLDHLNTAKIRKGQILTLSNTYITWKIFWLLTIIVNSRLNSIVHVKNKIMHFTIYSI